MNRYNKTRWPAWIVFAVTATLLVVGSVGMLAAKMIVAEWKAANVVLSWRAEANQLQASQKQALKHAGLQPVKSVAPSESDRQAIAQWQDIVAQIHHPYFESQIAILLESKNDTPASWVEHPIPLSQFMENNRPFLTTIYELCPPRDEPAAILAPLGIESLDRLKKLVFLDAASCLHTGDRERFDQALITFYQINQTYWRDIFSIEPLLCLLHRALDVNLLSPQEVEVWIDRLCKQDMKFPYWGNKEWDQITRLQTISGLDREWTRWWVPPSVILAIADREESRRQERQRTDLRSIESVYRTPAHKLALLGTRVALLNHVQRQSLPESLTALTSTQVVQSVEKAIAGILNESITSLIGYAKIGEGEAIIRKSEMDSLWKGPYPVHEYYKVQLGNL